GSSACDRSGHAAVPRGRRRWRRGRSRRRRRAETRVPGRTRGATQDSWTPSRASNLAEDVFRQQLLEIDRWLHFTNLSVRRNDLVRAARADANVLLADQALGLDRRDRVLLELDGGLEPQHDAGLIIRQSDRL